MAYAACESHSFPGQQHWYLLKGFANTFSTDADGFRDEEEEVSE